MITNSPVDAFPAAATAPTGFARGRRLFIAGCIVLLLFSATHMIPMFSDILGEPTAPAEVAAKRAMAAVTVDLGPFHTHWGKLNQLLSVSYSTLLYFIVALNFVALPAVVACRRLRALALVNTVFTTGLLVIAAAYQFPPPGVFALVATVLFGGAALRARSAAQLAAR